MGLQKLTVFIFLATVCIATVTAVKEPPCETDVQRDVTAPEGTLGSPCSLQGSNTGSPCDDGLVCCRQGSQKVCENVCPSNEWTARSVGNSVTSCYILFRTPMSWEQAQADCANLGAQLVVLEDPEESQWYKDWKRSKGYRDIPSWLGGYYSTDSGTYVWSVDGTTSTSKEIGWEDWLIPCGDICEDPIVLEPGRCILTSFGGVHGCIEIDIQWIPPPCTAKFAFVCELQKD